MKFIKKTNYVYILIVLFAFFVYSTYKINSSEELSKEDTKSKTTDVKMDTHVLSTSSKENTPNTHKEDEEAIDKECILGVTYERENVTIKSGLKEEELKNIFNNYEGASTMTHLSKAFIDAESHYGINALMMSAIVALESGFATSRRAVEDNNLTGFEVYADDSEGRLFSSQYDSIMYTAKHLANNYLTEGAVYYEGLSVDDIQVHYCPDEGKNKRWEIKVDKLASGFLDTYKELYTDN